MNHLFCNVCVCCQHVCLCCGRPLFTAQSGHPLPFHPHDPNNSSTHPTTTTTTTQLKPRHDRGGRKSYRSHLCGQLSHGDRCCNCQLMDCASRTSLGFSVTGPEGAKRRTGKRQSWLRREQPGDWVTAISLLTAAIGIDNMIGHALKESATNTMEYPHLPL